MNQTSKKISTEETGNRLNEGFERMDDSKLAGLKSVALIQDVKSSLKMREAKRLEVKYGASSPQAVKARAKVSYYQTIKVGIAEQVQMAATKTPRFEADSWRIQGRVVDTKNQGLSGLTVSLFDKKGNWIRVLGHACTDEKGFFVITYNNTDKKESLKAAKASEQPLIPTVSDKNKTVLHQEKEPVFLKIGRIDSRLIILGEDVCDTPPDKVNDDNNGNDQEKDENDAINLKDDWTVKGTVKDAKTGENLQGVTVKLFGKNIVLEGQTGKSVTDKVGAYVINCHKKDFQKLIDQKTGLYVKVVNQKGSILYISRKKIHFTEGKEEIFNIKVLRKG